MSSERDSLEKSKNFEELKEELINKLNEYEYLYAKIETLDELKKIHGFWCSDVIEASTTSTEYLYMGTYYYAKKDYKNAKKSYNKALELEPENVKVLSQLGTCCMLIKKNYKKMEHYFLKAIELEDDFAMNSLGWYYLHINKNQDLTKKYLLMSIERGNRWAMDNLGYHYQHIEKNPNEMKKYYRMAVENGHTVSAYTLGNYYFAKDKKLKALYYYLQIKYDTKSTKKRKDEIFKNIKEILDEVMNKKIIINKYFYQSLPFLKDYDLHPVLQIVVTLYTNKIDVLESAFKFLPEADGFNKAKDDFNNQLTII